MHKQIVFLKTIFIIFGIIFISINPNTSECQTVSKQDINTSDSIKNKVIVHSPTKAWIMSTIVPGLGQAYNKKYWKIPVIYTGFAVLGYFLITNRTQYFHYKELYYSKMDSLNNKLSTDISADEIQNLIAIKNYYRRNLELTSIFTGVLYLMNIIDANVDANLYDYDVSDNLSLNIKPYSYQHGYNSYCGLTLSLKIK